MGAATDLNAVVSAQRLHIGFFGAVNSGKSSLVNALTGQELSIVSDTEGTTTDPVQKAMELLPLGPVVIIDTPGLDDATELGRLRIERTMQMLRKTDIAVIVTDAAGPDGETGRFIEKVRERGIPFLVVRNKCDLAESSAEGEAGGVLSVSAKTGQNLDVLKRRITESVPTAKAEKRIVSDLLQKGDVVLLVTPIDESAPKGRLILPQQQTIRDILDVGGICITVQPDELAPSLRLLQTPPRMVICDSQVFGFVDAVVPEDIALTSFSILFARYRGNFEQLIRGARAIERLHDGDTVLISEGCTHRRQCGDIGTVKLPGWLQKGTGKELRFRFTSGGEFPEDLSGIDLVIHCGGCMLNASEMSGRLRACEAGGMSVTNYGLAIAKLHGILERSLSVFRLGKKGARSSMGDVMRYDKYARDT